MKKFSRMIGGTPAMQRLLADIERVARLDTTILIEGESGTGKELAARLLHDRHPRRASGPLVCVHCGAIPESLLESELFGHRRGAFTGADRDRVGKFEQADGGTLFLDEISTMSPEAQVRLLRVLQERQVTPLGANAAKPVDVRIVAATNENLKAMVERGEFRADLYYRIAAYPLRVAPLRERLADVPALVDHLKQKIAERLGLEDAPTLSAEAEQRLVRYDWPGNVRELENAVEYALVRAMDQAQMLPEHLPEALAHAAAGAARVASPVVTEQGVSFRTAISNLERDLILQSLDVARGNKARAAELLDLKRTTFLEKLRRIEGDPLSAA